MIKNIHLKNFQSHKDTLIKFDQGVNVIVGQSDVGKSAILRAIAWICTNKPSGDEFISSWADLTSIKIETDDCMVIREKGKGVNQYILKQGKGKDFVFKGFGQDIPEEVKQALNIQDINLRFQLQGPFFLSDSSGEVSRYLNRISRLDKIDEVIATIDSDLRSARKTLNLGLDLLIENQEKIKGYDWIDEAESQLRDLEALNFQLIDWRNQKSTIENILQAISEAEKRKEKFKFIKAKKQVLKLIKMDEEIATIDEKVDEIAAIIHLVKEFRLKLANFRFLGGLREKVYKGIDLKRSLDIGEINRVKIDFMIKSIIKKKEELKNHQKGMIDAKKEFNRLMPDQCPLCGVNYGK